MRSTDPGQIVQNFFFLKSMSTLASSDPKKEAKLAKEREKEEKKRMEEEAKLAKEREKEEKKRQEKEAKLAKEREKEEKKG